MTFNIKGGNILYYVNLGNCQNDCCNGKGIMVCVIDNAFEHGSLSDLQIVVFFFNRHGRLRLYVMPSLITCKATKKLYIDYYRMLFVIIDINEKEMDKFCLTYTFSSNLSLK